MYCIECGSKIPDNSKFCPQCGTKQTQEGHSDQELKATAPLAPINENATPALQKIANTSQFRKIFGYYLLWVALHMAILLIYSDGVFDSDQMGSDEFWPFNPGFSNEIYIGDYDITEFLTYTVVPLLILIVFKINQSQEVKAEVSTEQTE